MYPAKVEASGHPTDIIVNVKPATTAVRPITPCTYVGKKLDKPIMIAPDVKVAIFAKATSLSCHNRSGIIGEKAFFSLHKKAAMPIINTVSNMNVGPDNHSHSVPPSMNNTINEEPAMKNKPEPAQSIDRSSFSTFSCKNRLTPMMPIIPSEIFIQKIHAQS